MGVDFNLRIVKKESNGEIKPIFVKELPHLSQRWHHYFPLFIDNLDKIEKIANQKLDLDFYKKADSSIYGDESNKSKIYDPKKVKSTIELILKIIKDNPGKFPHLYAVGFKGEEYQYSSKDIFLGDNKIDINGGWDECYYMLNDKKVDLTKGNSEFSAYRVLCEKINDKKWLDKKGEKVTVVIKKYTIYEHFNGNLKDIIAICDYAIDHDYYVQGYTS